VSSKKLRHQRMKPRAPAKPNLKNTGRNPWFILLATLDASR
jgi:hypothetical protein